MCCEARDKESRTLLLLWNLLTYSSFNVLADLAPNDSTEEAETIGEGTFMGHLNGTSLKEWNLDYHRLVLPGKKMVVVDFTADAQPVGISIFGEGDTEAKYTGLVKTPVAV